jgi:hypothetical protein
MRPRARRRAPHPPAPLLSQNTGNAPNAMTNLTIERHILPMVASVCGLGAELALVVPGLAWLRARARRRAAG